MTAKPWPICSPKLTKITVDSRPPYVAAFFSCLYILVEPRKNGRTWENPDEYGEIFRLPIETSLRLTLQELIEGARQDPGFQSRLRVMDIDENLVSIIISMGVEGFGC